MVGVLAVAGLLLGAPAAGQASSPGKGAEASVINGTTAPIAAFPWLVHITYEGSVDKFACTGSVVAPRLVLTAGHCAVSESGRVLRPNDYSVTWGTANVEKADAARTTPVSKVLLFPGYNPNSFRHDAALLVLSAPVGVPPIPLATAADGALYAGGTPITIAGWGLTDGDGKLPPASFRSGETVVGTTSFCERKTFANVVPFEPATQLCASDRRRHKVGACSGDSGGPGIAHRADGSPVQVGIISTGGPFCDLSFPEIQTRVDRLAPWIASWFAAVEAGAPPPAIAPPRLYRLPKLSFPEARLFTFLILVTDFRRSFLDGRAPKLDCRRIDREKVKCGVFWRRDRTVYGGGLTIFYVLPREGSLLQFSYRIRKVHEGCWERRGFKRCPGPVFTDEER
jgi:hypothetical protein